MTADTPGDAWSSPDTAISLLPAISAPLALDRAVRASLALSGLIKGYKMRTYDFTRYGSEYFMFILVEDIYRPRDDGTGSVGLAFRVATIAHKLPQPVFDGGGHRAAA
jgi:hypothetical protein